MGRHGAQPARRRHRTVLLVLVPVLVLALLGWQAWARFGDRLTGAAGEDCSEPPTVPVATTAAMLDPLESVLARVTDVCAAFTVSAEPSAVVAQRLEDAASDDAASGQTPAIWVPDSRLLAEQVAASATGVVVGESIAETPVLLAVPEGLEAPDPATWGATIVDPDTRLPDPATSTVGSIALMVGLSEIDQQPEDQRAEILAGIGGMLSRVVPEETLLTNHTGTTDAAIFPTTEQQVALAAVPGLAVQTADSATPALDYPLVSTSAAPEHVVSAVNAALTSSTGRDALRSAGFRTHSDPSPVIEDGPPAELDASPSPDQAEAAQQMWQAIATPTSLLTVIDTSGSMSEPADAGGGSRIEVAARAATGAIELLSDHNSVGLWIFSTRQQGDQDWTELQPLGELRENDQRSKLSFALGSLGTRLGGDTGLYDTIDAAYETLLESYDPQAVNLIALFTDGVNDDPEGGLSLDQLSSRLAKNADPEKPVTVLLIGMGGVDAEALRPAAQAIPTEGGGGGAVFAIEKPQDIADVYVTMLLRRLPQG